MSNVPLNKPGTDAIQVCHGFDTEYLRTEAQLKELATEQIAWHFWRAATMEANAHAAAVSAAKDAEIAALRAEVAGLRELLEVAQQGLLWYQDTYPNVVNDCDHEVMAQIAAALAARKGEA